MPKVATTSWISDNVFPALHCQEIPESLNATRDDRSCSCYGISFEAVREIFTSASAAFASGRLQKRAWRSIRCALWKVAIATYVIFDARAHKHTYFLDLSRIEHRIWRPGGFEAMRCWCSTCEIPQNTTWSQRSVCGYLRFLVLARRQRFGCRGAARFRLRTTGSRKSNMKTQHVSIASFLFQGTDGFQRRHYAVLQAKHLRPPLACESSALELAKRLVSQNAQFPERSPSGRSQRQRLAPG